MYTIADTVHYNYAGKCPMSDADWCLYDHQDNHTQFIHKSVTDSDSTAAFFVQRIKFEV